MQFRCRTPGRTYPAFGVGEGAWRARRRRAEERSIDVDKLREAYERNELMSSVGADLRNEKLFDRLIEIATVKDGEELSYVDLLSGKG